MLVLHDTDVKICNSDLSIKTSQYFCVEKLYLSFNNEVIDPFKTYQCMYYLNSIELKQFKENKF